MSQSRKDIVTFAAHSSVDTVYTAIDAGEDLDKPTCLETVDSNVDSILAEISALEKVEELSKAAEMFPVLAKADPKQALAAKRRMARRASEANIHTAWLTAQMAGGNAGECEAYRKASTMRLGPAQIESELAELCVQAGIKLTPCGKAENGKWQKVKASASAAMALEKLQKARQAMRALQVETESKLAAMRQLETLKATSEALKKAA